MPGVGDDVFIPTGFSQIVHGSGTTVVNSINSSSPFTLSGGSLSVATSVDIDATFVLAGGLLKDATVASDNTISVLGESRLSNVTLNGDLDMTHYWDTRLRIDSGWTLNGTVYLGSATDFTFGRLLFEGSQLIDGNGDIVLGNRYDNMLVVETPDTVVTLADQITVHGLRGQ